MESFIHLNPELLVRLFVAMLLGMAIGAERIFANKTAGMRTHALVAMGSALFVIIADVVSMAHGQNSSLDQIRMASQVVVGVGFLGAGLIVFQDSQVKGLTTASGLWVSAAIGIATGFGLYTLAIAGVILTLFIFTVLWFIEERIKHLQIHGNKNGDGPCEHPLEHHSMES